MKTSKNQDFEVKWMNHEFNVYKVVCLNSRTISHTIQVV